MVERKKRGLGRGLGALIPDANSNDRPVDVFFSGGNSEDGKRESETKTSRTARTDPAASMQSSRRRKPKVSGTARSTSTTSGADTETEAAASKTASSNAGATKSGATKSGTTKGASSTSSKASASKPAGSKSTASESTASKSTASKSTGTKTSTSKTTGTKASTAKSSASKATAQKATGSGSSRTSAGAKSTSTKTKAGSSARPRSGPSSASPVESAQKASAAPTNTTRKTSSSDSVSDPATGSGEVETPATDSGEVGTPAASSSAESSSAQLTGNESVDVSSGLINDSQSSESAAAASAEDDVRETHPGVYTSSGRSHDNNEADERDQSARSGIDEQASTTTVVESESMDAEDESRPAGPWGSDTSTASEPDARTSTSASSEESGRSESEETADKADLEDYDGVESIPDTEFGEIDVDLIDANPRQPRTVFDEDLLAELVHSIREIGVLQPVVVRQKPSDRSRFELIMGERRLRATKDAGLSTIPAIIRYVEDTDLLRDALLENLHRAELNPLEEAAAYGQLLEDFGCTQEELSERIGRSRPQISNTLRLLRLPPLVQRRVAAGVISAGHARAILGLRDPEHMEVLAQRIVAEGLSVRASEEAVVLLNRGDSINVSRATTKVAPEFLAVAERLGDRLETKVNISVGKRKGKLSVEFANQEDLDRILGLLGISNEDAL